ncbi:SMP-30/gluconolactonase/LRE family protein [Reinekea sp.]|jgi:sugar lactone lactonase YvrE|uniref:SMP-30/gluconolactonase/LRE family protein n=1 Tax=Reinekea sp. TaxID=1970455 RepID=UPI002A826626|nr:SMP-30/gluconolactonase/LRE family protein [Reinekea sp.]
MPQISVLANLNHQLGESPVWNSIEQAWYWVDITGQSLNCYRTADKALDQRLFDFKPTYFGFTDTNEMVLTGSAGVFRLADLHAEPILLCHPERHLPGNRFNDGVATPDGDFIAGTLGDGNSASGTAYRCGFARGQLSCTPIQDGYRIINGQAFSPDGQWYYVTDTPTQRVLRYPYDRAQKRLGKAELFYQFSAELDRPDGAAVDRQGNYWIALHGAGTIAVISPAGERIRDILLPISKPTMVAFGGPRLNQLLVTSACQELDAAQLAAEPLAGAILLIDLDADDLGTEPNRINTTA